MLEKQVQFNLETLELIQGCHLIMGMTIDGMEAIILFHEREWRNLKADWYVKMSANILYQKQNP